MDLENIVNKIAFSNYQNLLQQVLAKLDEKIDKVYPEGRFRIVFSKPDGQESKINITFSSKQESFVKVKGSNDWQIHINTEYNDKDEAYRSLAHEITHISQHFNDFNGVMFDNLFKKYTKFRQDRKDVKFNQFKNELHEELPTEQEAKMVGLLILLKRNQPDKATKDLFDEPKYYQQIPFRKFIKAAYSLGLTSKDIENFQVSVYSQLNKWFAYLDQGLVNNYGEFFTSVYDRLIAVRNFLHINIQKYAEKLKIAYQKIEKKGYEWNWNFIEKELNGL